jgi:hypothetical protein
LELAEKLRAWLPAVLPFAEPWVSPDDIEKGTLWIVELSRGLADTPFGILCVTPENRAAHWLLFEAGAIARSSSRVAPLLLGITPGELPAPLAQFQATLDTEDDVRRLVRSINRAAGDERLEQEAVNRLFEKRWPELRDALQSIRQAAAPGAAAAAPAARQRLPEVRDEELWILREMDLYGGRARREFHNQRGGSSTSVNSIWFGMMPVDYYESRWIYEAIDGSMKKKGFIESSGNDYRVAAHGERALAAYAARRLENLPPIVDALSGEPYE